LGTRGVVVAELVRWRWCWRLLLVFVVEGGGGGGMVPARMDVYERSEEIVDERSIDDVAVAVAVERRPAKE
jgi:hypothetical protein